MKEKVLTVLLLFLISGSINFGFPKMASLEAATIDQAPSETTAQSVTLPTSFRSWFQIGLRAGAIAPGVGIVLDFTGLPIGINEKVALMTRIGYGLVSGNDEGGGVLYLDELLFYELADTPIATYIGGGINKPSKNNSDFGINFVLGLTGKTTLFHTGNEAVFIETGVNNYSVPGFNKSALIAMLGYRRLF